MEGFSGALLLLCALFTVRLRVPGIPGFRSHFTQTIRMHFSLTVNDYRWAQHSDSCQVIQRPSLREWNYNSPPTTNLTDGELSWLQPPPCNKYNHVWHWLHACVRTMLEPHAQRSHCFSQGGNILDWEAWLCQQANKVFTVRACVCERLSVSDWVCWTSKNTPCWSGAAGVGTPQFHSIL